jgi:hypothetical protein
MRPRISVARRSENNCMQISIIKNGNQTGPFTEEQARSMISAGMISNDDLAWTTGASDWRPLHAVLGSSQPPPIPDSTSFTSTAPTTIAPSNGPRGVGGWLVMFCVGLTILSPLLSLSQMVSNWGLALPAFSRFPTIKSAMIWEYLGSTAILIYGFIVGCIIWSGSPKGRDIARNFLGIRLVGIVAVEIIAFLVLGDLPSEMMKGVIGGAVGTLFREGVYFAVWWSYFVKSKRVQNTYGHE